MRKLEKTDLPKSLIYQSILFFSCLCVLSGCMGLAKNSEYTSKISKESKINNKEMNAASAYDSAKRNFLAGNLTEALQDINHSLELNSSVAESLLLKEQVLMEIGRSEKELLLVAEEGLKVTPDDARFNYYLGVFYERRGETSKALVNYKKAAAIDDSSVQYKLAVAEVMIESVDFSQVKQFLLKAIKKHPNAPGLLQAMGSLHLIHQDYPKAIIYFSEALALAPAQGVLKENLAKSYYQMNKFKRAMQYLEQLKKSKYLQNRYDLQVMAAECYLQCERPVAARGVLAELLKDPSQESFHLWKMMADASILLDDLAQMDQAARRMVALEPTNEEGYLALSRCMELKGDRSAALQILDGFYLKHRKKCSRLFLEYKNSLSVNKL